MIALKSCLLAFLLVTAAHGDDAASFMDKVKEYSKKMMPIQFDVKLTLIQKPRFTSKEEAEKYEREKMKERIGISQNGPSAKEAKEIHEKNVHFLINGCTGTTYYKCKSVDSKNYQFYAIDGATNNCVQVVLFDDNYECQYRPDHNSLLLLPPSIYTREGIFLFEHERAYNYLENGSSIEEKNGDYFVRVNDKGEPNFLMKFKKDRAGFPLEITMKTQDIHIDIFYRKFSEIDRILFPLEIEFNQYNYHEVTNNLYLKYVFIYEFSNIKIDKTMKKEDLDITVPPGTLVQDRPNNRSYVLEGEEKFISVRKEIMK